MKKYLFITAGLVVLLISGCFKPAPPTSSILCGTTMVLSLVKDCAPDANTAVLIPSEACPGTYDLKPSDAKKISSARLFIVQPFLKPLAEKALKANPKLVIEYVNTADMQVPENYFRGLQETASILAKNDSTKAQYYIENMNQKIRAIREAVINDSAYLMKLKSKKIKVLVSGYQEALAAYLGFDAVYVFGAPASLTPAAFSTAISKAKQKGASLIISNLTGDHDASADILNKGLKIKKTVLISFPGEAQGQSMFLNMWAYNLGQIRSACGE